MGIFGLHSTTKDTLYLALSVGCHAYPCATLDYAETNHRKATGHCQSPRSAGFHARMHVGVGRGDRVSPVYWQISVCMLCTTTGVHDIRWDRST
ncbi:hypothetical protein BC827DRAFT_1222714 [Russula dissimulans]|nr:hypothetical protein BC827DRAFT_1247965 [Russula dissimulans]KAH9957967.1 hypothetical protein BC827DRAFT_1222714 [Russula dissimulans]